MVFTDSGFGFPVVIHNADTMNIRGKIVPKVNLLELERTILERLVVIQRRLTGNEVRFIRLWLKMGATAFANTLGVTHPAVLGWEKRGDRPTTMNWGTEFLLRFNLATELNMPTSALVDFAASKVPVTQSDTYEPMQIVLDTQWVACANTSVTSSHAVNTKAGVNVLIHAA
ncbi:MAG: hypothetical protein AMXMBFR84_26520 [Candidatus Hydrogenedentota bacterium]